MPVALLSTLVCFVLITGTQSATAGGGSGGPLVPDLIVEEPDKILLYQESGRAESGRRKRTLRFSHTTANLGAGPLEIFPDLNDTGCGGDGVDSHAAYQRLYLDDDGDGVFDPGEDQLTETRSVGCMIFHEVHNHYHFEDFALYRLYRERTGELEAMSDKISFCVYDYRPSAAAGAGLPGMPDSPAYDFFACDRDDGTHGISVGWQDTYSASTQGQSLAASDIRKGRYCLVATADPTDRLDELAPDGDVNNSTEVRIRIKRRNATAGGAPVKRFDAPCRYSKR